MTPLVAPSGRRSGGAPATCILIVGGGYVGLYTALTLQKRLHAELRDGKVRITVVDPRAYMTYQPFLPETAAGSLEGREVVVSLRRELKRCTVIEGRLTQLDHDARQATVAPVIGAPYTLSYDVVVVAPGSIAKTLPIPGLADVGIGFKQVEEAVGLRNHVLSRLDVAASTADPDVRAKALSFVFVGGGYAGIEAFAELEDMARYATRYLPDVAPEDMRWMLVEASPRILGEVSEPLAEYTVERLRERGMDIRLSTRLESCVDGNVRLSDGTELASDTVVWTAGVKPNPVLEHTGFVLDKLHRVPCTADLRVRGVDGAWSAGDSAAVPDLTKGDGSADSPTCAPNAQHAVRQARLLGANIVRSLRGQRLKEYKHHYAGSVASLGLYQGVAEIYGVKLKGLPAWGMHRAYHVSRMPTANRKARILGEWGLSLLYRRDVVPIAELSVPTREFRAAAEPVERAAHGAGSVDDSGAAAAARTDDLGRDPRVDGPVTGDAATAGGVPGPGAPAPGEAGDAGGDGAARQPVGDTGHASGQLDRTAPQSTPTPPDDRVDGRQAAAAAGDRR